MAKCIYCGEKIIQPPKTRTKVYCSAACKMQAFYKRKREREEIENPKPIVVVAITPAQKIAVKDKIKEIQLEKLPNHIKTPLGKNLWRYDRDRRINELKKQLV